MWTSTWALNTLIGKGKSQDWNYKPKKKNKI